jgi:hypothetical protein
MAGLEIRRQKPRGKRSRLTPLSLTLCWNCEEIRLRTRGPMIGSSETDSGGLVLSKTFYGVTSNPPRYAPAYTKLAGIHFDILIPRCCAVWEPTSRCTQELLRHSTVQSTMNVYTQAVSEQKRIANSAVVGLLFGRGSFVLANGNQQALTAAQLVFIQSHSSDCYCGA